MFPLRAPDRVSTASAVDPPNCAERSDARPRMSFVFPASWSIGTPAFFSCAPICNANVSKSAAGNRMLSDVSEAHEWICFADSLNTASPPPMACSRSLAAEIAAAANPTTAAPAIAPFRFLNLSPIDSAASPTPPRSAAAFAASTSTATFRTADLATGSTLPSPLVPLRLLRTFLVNPQHRRDHFVVLVEPRTDGNRGCQTDLDDESSPGSPVVGSTSVSGAVASTMSASSMNVSNDPAYCPVRLSAAHDTNASHRDGLSDNPPHGGFCRFPVVSNRM